MARIIEWDGLPFAVLVESVHGSFLVPPIVLDPDGNPIEGREVLAAIALANANANADPDAAAISVPVLRDATPAILAEVDRRMARLSHAMGVPLWPAG